MSNGPTQHLPPPPGKPEQADVLLVVEQEADSKFRIQSDQLELIGAKLRGRRHFSVFNSLVLPALVTLVTTILTGTFQYMSWINTVRLQAATAVSDRATDSFGEAASLIGRRTYATVIFIPSIRNLAATKAVKPSLPATAVLEKPTLPAITALDKREPAAADAAVTGSLISVSAGPAVTPAPAADPDNPLIKVNTSLETRRFNIYYEQLKLWNEQYDQLLTDIDNNLDRPIWADAGIARTPITAFYNKLKQIDCRNSLSEELDKVGLDKHSLKLQFAGINRCFGVLHGSLDTQLTKFVKHTSTSLDLTILEGASGRLDHLRTMANEFRCMALMRIAYYKHQKERSIVLPNFVRRWLFDPTKANAEQHFADSDKSCSPANRPT